MSKEQQLSMFTEDETVKWKEEWKGMPEFVQEDQTSWKSIIVHFESEKEMKDFASLVGQKLTYKTQSIWYPQAEIATYADKCYSLEENEPIKEQGCSHSFVGNFKEGEAVDFNLMYCEFCLIQRPKC